MHHSQITLYGGLIDLYSMLQCIKVLDILPDSCSIVGNYYAHTFRGSVLDPMQLLLRARDTCINESSFATSDQTREKVPW